jgi:hypothetical protein
MYAMYSQASFALADTPSVDAQSLFEQGEVSLSGDWNLKWGDWVAFEDIYNNKAEIRLYVYPTLFLELSITPTKQRQVRFMAMELMPLK